MSGSAISRNFTHYVYLCVCLHVRDMYVICMRQRGHFTLKAAGTSLSRQRALSLMMEWSLFHSQGSAALSVFHALYACGSSGTFTLSLSRQRGGTWACRRRRPSGLHARWSLLEFAFEFVGVCVESGGLSRAARVLRSCGPAALRPCGCVLCCHAVSDACGTTWHHLCLPLCQPLR